jgi:membrane fusion protein, heavy metal efflux system
MNGKTLLLLVGVALGGLILGAWSAHHFGSWETVTQTISTLRQRGSHAPPQPRVAPKQPIAHTEHEDHEEHEGHGDKDDTPGQGTAMQRQDTDPHDHPEAKGAHLPKTDTHSHPGDASATRAAMPGQEHDKHGHGNDAHGHDEERIVALPEERVKQLGIDVAVAQAGSLQTQLTLPGTVTLNADKRVHVVSRIPGIVQEIRKTLGDSVRAGDVMAVLDSRELADAKATYLAARERLRLAESTFSREEDLWKKQISPEQDYLTAKQALAEARIEHQVSAQKLRALGFSEAFVQHLTSRPNAPLTRYEVTAPLTGTVIEKHIAVGEVLKDDTEAFIVADLSTVWVDLNVPVNDLPLVRQGQRVVVEAGPAMKAEGTIAYVSPVVSEDTHTAVTRVVLPNPDGSWRPGLFVTATIAVSNTPVSVLIPKTAVQTVDGQSSVFVYTPEGFVPRPVTLGHTNATHVEVTAGLQAGERYAATETFVLKAEIGKGAASHDH